MAVSRRANQYRARAIGNYTLARDKFAPISQGAVPRLASFRAARESVNCSSRHHGRGRKREKKKKKKREKVIPFAEERSQLRGNVQKSRISRGEIFYSQTDISM